MVDDKTVVGRATAILDVVAGARAPLMLAELTRRTGIPKPTVRRIAASLAERGLLDRTARGYVPGERLRRYGMLAASRSPATLIVQPYVQDLYQYVRGEVAWFASAGDGELTAVSTAFGKAHVETMRTSPWPPGDLLGPSVVLLASGRLEVAHQPERAERILASGWGRMTRYSVTDPRRMRNLLAAARDTRFAQEDEQCRLGWSCMASLLLAADGTMIGALGVTGRTAAITSRGLRGVLVRSADVLEGELRSCSVPHASTVARGPIRVTE